MSRNYRVPLSFEEEDMERYGFNMYDGDPDDMVGSCKICEEPYATGEGDKGICPDCELYEEELDDCVIHGRNCVRC